ncbi:MAG TPA: M28 family peptidase [Solirubrobacteraceae bacterium]|nr:M28 family peptidase [Solirubrobacteraceae bacterium]
MSAGAETSDVGRQTAPQAQWRAAIHDLAAFDRPSASEGERRAAEWIAQRLSQLGCQVDVEEEQAHGRYWWPIVVANLLSAASGAGVLRRRHFGSRLLGLTVSGAAAAALWDDLGHGRRWFRRRFFTKRSTWNVVARVGDPDAPRTVALVAHHDAAHSGLVFHPALGRIGPRLLPRLHERSKQAVPILYGVWLGPVITALGALAGSRRVVLAGVTVSLGATGVMLDIARSPVVPGANDNLSAVGVLLAVAEALRNDPIPGVRTLLLSTGSEESFSEGMQAFGRRHFPELDPERTEFLCLECLGGPTLIVLEAEGMLKMRHYTPGMRESLAQAAAQAGVNIARGLRTVAATDAIIALRAGYPAVTLASVAETKLPLNYHWPSDRPEALHWETIEQAIAVCTRFLRDRANGVRLSNPG